MAWLIIVFILIVVLVRLSSASRRNANKMRMGGAMSGVPPTMSSVPTPARAAPVSQPGNSATYAPGDSATYRPGDAATYRPGDSETYRPGDSETYRPGDSATYRPGDSATYRPGDSATYAPGNPGVYRPGDSTTYAPAGQVASRPNVTPPAATMRPVDQGPSESRKRTQRQTETDGGYQPAYATMTEIATAWRDQSIIDKDHRTASRTGPTQAPYQGSTAISSSSLNTTLAMPYQPSSLTSSLSSSLSTSLGDSSHRMPSNGSSVLAEISVVQLPRDVVEQVLVHLRNGHEVEAVRLVSDQMNVGLLEATKTVRSYASR